MWSVYVDTKSKSQNYTVTVLGTNKVAFVLSQKVTYTINDEAGTVKINSYTPSFTAKLSVSFNKVW